MTVYVDDVRLRYGRMVMSHMWADDLAELIDFARQIGVNPKWLQTPPKASWTHFDISLGKKAIALKLGAVLTDMYGPSEFVAIRRCNFRMLENIAITRDMHARNSLYDRAT